MTAKFIRNPPPEPFCYRRLLPRGYGLDKVNLGTDDLHDKPSSKRKTKEAIVSAKSTMSDPITLEEESSEDKNEKKVRASTSAEAEQVAQPETKESRLESILSTVNTK